MIVKSYVDIPLRKVKMEGAKGTSIRWLISKLDGATNFAMRLFEMKPGGHSPLHTHPYEHEIYVLKGEGILIYEGKEYKLEKDYCVFVPPNKLHQFKNIGKTLLKFLCLIPV